MSGRHTGRTSQGLRITALPGTLKLLFRLAPRQLNDEIAFAKVELKRKGIQVGVAAAFLAVALVFVAFLLVGLIVAAIMALIGALIGVRKLKKAMPLMPEETIRGIKYDLGIAKEGTGFNAALLDPTSPEAKAAKAAKDEAAAKAKAEKEAKAEAQKVEFPHASEPELHRRLEQRRRHIAEVRDELDTELDVKPQVKFLVGAAKEKLGEGKAVLEQGKAVAARKFAALSESTEGGSVRWKPLAALAASATIFVVLLRRLLRNP
jgi:hypothetical protein